MEGVLEGSVVLCVCKLAASLLFLPSLTASSSPVSFCCCCILIFTDFLVTVFLSFLCIFESWLTDLTPSGDVIALRFLLFLSHTYGAVLLLTTFLIAMETLIRLLWPHTAVHHRTESQTVGSDGQGCYGDEGPVNEVEHRSLPQVVGFLCCLSVWFIVALNVRWRLKMEVAWAAVCLHATNSLVSCLPNIYSPMPLNPCWSILAIVCLLMLLLTRLQRQHRPPAQIKNTNDEKQHGCCRHRQSEPLKPVHPGTLVLEPVQRVDPEKTTSSCTSHETCSWNSVQMLVCHHRDLVVISSNCSSERRDGRELERTKTGLPVASITEEHVDSQHTRCCGWRLWGFPSLEQNLITGLVSVLFIFTLPFNLSVNILLIRTIDSVLDYCVKYLLSSAAKPNDTSPAQV